jgi:hypothetical protein
MSFRGAVAVPTVIASMSLETFSEGIGRGSRHNRHWPIDGMCHVGAMTICAGKSPRSHHPRAFSKLA